MPKITSNTSNSNKQPESVSGLLGGLNVFQDETLIKDSELTDARNILLSVDGIEPRPGTNRVGGDGGGSKVYGGVGFYMAIGTRQFLRMQNGQLKSGLTTPTAVSGTNSYNATARCQFVVARNKVYLFNGIDPLTMYDGSTLTVFTAMTTPVGLGISVQGSAGTTTYSYRISAFNNIGETLACSSVTTGTGNATLSLSNFNRLTWTATTGATGYNVWGRKATGLGETYITTVYTNTYDDNGEFDQTTSLPPEANSTAGIICSMGIFGPQQRIFGAGDPNYPSRLYWGGLGSNIGNFSGSTEGGGAVDVFKDDGSTIRDILPFQGGVIVWKDNAVFKFSFTSSGDPQIEEITRSFGGIAFRGSRHVENDVIFPARKDGRLAFYSLGNQENYAGTVLRTNELSIKVAPELENVEVSRLNFACSFYYNNIYGCSISDVGSTVNDKTWCLDTRFGAWTYWDGFAANFYMVYTDTDGSQKLYAGDDSSGYMIEMFTSARNDSGTAISGLFAMKSHNQKAFKLYKKYFDPTFQFKDITGTGTINGDIILDGATVASSFSISAQTTGGAGVGSMLVGSFLPGEDINSTPPAELSADTPIEIKTVKKARSIKYRFRFSANNSRFKFLGYTHDYMMLGGKDLPSDSRTYPA